MSSLFIYPINQYEIIMSLLTLFKMYCHIIGLLILFRVYWCLTTFPNNRMIIMVRVLIVLSLIFFCRCTLLYSVTDMLMIPNFTEGCSYRLTAKSSNLICVCNFIRCNHKCSSMSNSSTIGKDECELKLMLLRKACLQSKGHKTHHYQTWPLWRPIHPLANLSYGSNHCFHILHNITLRSRSFLRTVLKCVLVLNGSSNRRLFLLLVHASVTFGFA